MIKRPISILSGVFCVVLGCGGQAASGTKNPGDTPIPEIKVSQTKVFTGKEGFRVDVAELEDGDALVVVSGVKSELAGKVFRCKVESDGPYLRHTTGWHGRDLNLLVRREPNGGGDATWTSYVPDATNDGFEVKYSDELSPKLEGDKLKSKHIDQIKSGELAKIQDFDRKAEMAQIDASLAEEAKLAAKECGGAEVPLSVAWDTVSDELILDRKVAGYCASLYSGISNVCRFDSGKKFVASTLKSAQCRFDGDHELTLKGTTATWAISVNTYNLDQHANTALRGLEVGGQTLSDTILVEETTVCTDKSGKYTIMWGPEDAPHHGMAYGEGSNLAFVNAPQDLGGNWFFDPRETNPQNNPGFRGYDLRFYSRVEADRSKGTCSVTCGARAVELKLLDDKAKAAAISGAKFVPSPNDREPYALARDRKGTYYYVDRGNTAETAKDFHLYRGQRGRLKPLSMRDVVSDSEGEIFASETGKLRLIVGKEEAQWIATTAPQKLTRLPLAENYGLIYNELGVYLGDRLGVPCDDL